jgi:hypothetical protein
MFFFFGGEVLQPCEEKKGTLATITKALFWEKNGSLVATFGEVLLLWMIANSPTS